ncbi:MAG: pyridoxal phosphate-dependent aminotransferase [Exilispira sp.]|jgi:aspartate aminotransferase|nr:pyridoxal phosphate-dependent aminotransferase [Exilispira sp.]
MISKRITELKPSPTLVLDSRVKQLMFSGIPVLSLTLGEPDFVTPKHIAKAGIEAIKRGFTHYTQSAGIPELRQAICHKLIKENKIHYKPTEVIVGVGTKQLLASAFQVLCEKEIEVIVPIPTWSTYIEQIKLSGAKPVLIPLKTPFKVTAEAIEKYISKKTKVLLLNSPANPTGILIEKKELRKIANLAISKHIYVISDEIYEKILYQKKHYSIASFGKKIKDLTVTINGFSKSYAMTGWRVGYAAGPEKIIQAMTSLASQTTSGTCSISQKAALAALTGNQSPVLKMVSKFKERRDLMIQGFSQIKEISFTKPEGAFYLFINIKKLISGKYKTATQWSKALLEKTQVAVVPGEAFYAPGYIRISFTSPIKDLKEAIKRITKFIKEEKI